VPLTPENLTTCPVCHQLSVPKFQAEDSAIAAACQNDDCRWWIGRDGTPMQQISVEDYKR
jgi:hypothetical protein